jgi:hypothetical protein
MQLAKAAVKMNREQISELMKLDSDSALGTIRDNLLGLDRLGVRVVYPVLVLLRELEDLPDDVSEAIIEAVQKKRQKQKIIDDEF